MTTVLSVILLTQSVIVQPPTGVPLQCNPKWTHWVVESSCDLVHWRNRPDVQISVWPDGTNCTVIVTPTKSIEMFRVAGDTI